MSCKYFHLRSVVVIPHIIIFIVIIVVVIIIIIIIIIITMTSVGLCNDWRGLRAVHPVGSVVAEGEDHAVSVRWTPPSDVRASDVTSLTVYWCQAASRTRGACVVSLRYRSWCTDYATAHYTLFYRATLREHYYYMLSSCLSVRPSLFACVRLSDTSRHCTKRLKRLITQTTPYDSAGTLVFWCQKSGRNSDGVTPNGGAK